MSSVMSPASADEALEMLTAAMGYLAAADATAMTAEEQARCLRVLERATSVGTAARTSVLGAFGSGQGYSADADYSPRAWLIHKTGVTKGAAVSYTAWVRRAEDHPRVLAALATGDLPESVARILCQWTNRLPEDQRDLADDKLVAAALAGMSLQDLAELYGEIYEQSRSASPDEDKDEVFDDRAVRLITTFQGAGVMSGDLTPECAEAVAAVLDALSAPAGAEDDRTREQRYHDALQEAMTRLIAAGILPERAGQPVQDLGAYLAGGSAPAGRQLGAAGTVDGAGPGPVGRAPRRRVRGRRGRRRLAGRRRRRGDRLRRGDGPHRDRRRQRGRAGQTWSGCAWSWTRGGVTVPGTRPGRRSSRPSSARPSTCCPAPAGWRASCAAASSAPGCPGRACRWTSGTARPFPAGIRNAVTLRDKHCQWAGRCDQPAEACQVHHTRHKANGGPTSVKDCVLLCWFHHQVVIHRWGWTLVLNPDGTTTAWNKDKTKVLHSHGPPGPPGVTSPVTAAPRLGPAG